MTIPLAKLAGELGVVHAFEPLRATHNLLCSDATLNGQLNVVAHHALVGSTSKGHIHKAPHGFYSMKNNFGSTPFDIPGGPPDYKID